MEAAMNPFDSSSSSFTGTMPLGRQLFDKATGDPQRIIEEFRLRAKASKLNLIQDSWWSTEGFGIRGAGSFSKELVRHLNSVPERSSGEQIFDVIQSLYLSSNRPRDRQIAERITTIHRDSLAEGERIIPASIAQFAQFFLAHSDLGLPKITLTPDGTLRARWIHGPGNFVAIEFTGVPLAKLVAEVPRDRGLTAPHFASEPLNDIVPVARAIGASFA
jgi:hypothetical protein